MPYVQAYVDSSDVIDDLTDQELESEFRSRQKNGDHITREDSRVALDEASHCLHKLGRFDLAFKLDEIKHDYF